MKKMTQISFREALDLEESATVSKSAPKKVTGEDIFEADEHRRDPTLTLSSKDQIRHFRDM